MFSYTESKNWKLKLISNIIVCIAFYWNRFKSNCTTNFPRVGVTFI